jgi:hypothetical protein
VYERPLREGSARESTSSLSPGAALVLTLLYSAGLWAGMWLSVMGCFGEKGVALARFAPFGMFP